MKKPWPCRSGHRFQFPRIQVDAGIAVAAEWYCSRCPFYEWVEIRGGPVPLPPSLRAEDQVPELWQSALASLREAANTR